MKIFVYILSTLVSTATILAFAVLLVVLEPRPHDWHIAVEAGAFGLIVYGAIAIGAASFYWDPRSSSEGGRALRRFQLIYAVVEAVAVVAIIVLTATAGASLWIPITAIVVGAIYTVIAIVIASALRRRDDRRTPATSTWGPVDAGMVRRKVRTIAITFVVALIAGLLLFFAVGDDLSSTPTEVLSSGILAVSMGLFAAGLACAIVSLPVSRKLRELLNRDLGLQRRISKVVLKAKDIDLTPAETVIAARYAVVAPFVFRFLVGMFGLFYGGFLLDQVSEILDPTDNYNAVQLVYLIGLIVAAAIFLPITVRQLNRAKRYAAAHADLLADDAAPTASAPEIAHP